MSTNNYGGKGNKPQANQQQPKKPQQPGRQQDQTGGQGQKPYQGGQQPGKTWGPSDQGGGAGKKDKDANR